MFWCIKEQLVHRETSKTSSCFVGHLDHPYKCFVVSRHNVCIDRHPRHPPHLDLPYNCPGASRYNLCIYIHWTTSRVMLNIFRHPMSDECSLMHWWTYCYLQHQQTSQCNCNHKLLFELLPIASIHLCIIIIITSWCILLHLIQLKIVLLSFYMKSAVLSWSIWIFLFSPYFKCRLLYVDDHIQFSGYSPMICSFVETTECAPAVA